MVCDLWGGGGGGAVHPYFFPIVLVACNLVFLGSVLFEAGRKACRAERRIHAGGRRRAGAAVQLAVLLCFAPWLPVALRQISTWPSGAVTFTAADAPVVILGTLSEGLRAPSGDTL